MKYDSLQIRFNSLVCDILLNQANDTNTITKYDNHHLIIINIITNKLILIAPVEKCNSDVKRDRETLKSKKIETKINDGDADSDVDNDVKGNGKENVDEDGDEDVNDDDENARDDDDNLLSDH